jgi:hypothetical protein
MERFNLDDEEFQKRYQEKCDKFTAKTGIEAFRTKTSNQQLPLLFYNGSGSHNPEQKVQMQTSDIVLWVKFLDKWFRPYGQFTEQQIMDMINLCRNDQQIESLFRLLSATDEKELPENTKEIILEGLKILYKETWDLMEKCEDHDFINFDREEPESDGVIAMNHAMDTAKNILDKNNINPFIEE